MQRPVLRPESAPSRRALDNGSVLLTRALPETYGIGVAVLIGTGTRDERTDQGGISHLLEHMVFKGTAKRTAFELARDMEALGGQLDAYTTKEHTAYTVKVLPDQLEPALEILADMLERSTFPADQLALEKQVVIEEIFSAEDTPDDVAHERFCEHLWPGHPLSHPILGTEESVNSIGREALAEHCARVHVGENIIVGAAGALGDHEEELVARAFGFPAGNSVRGENRGAGPAPGSHSHVREGLSQEYVEIGVPALAADHPERFALSLLSSVLGGGMSSRLFQRVREEEGLAYGIYNYCDFFRDTGMIGTSFSASPDKCARAVEIVAEEYARMRRGELADDELESNKAQLVSSVVLGMESVLSQALRMVRSESLYGRFVPVAEIVERVDAVTRDEVIAVADRFLDPSLQTLSAYGPVDGVVWPT